MLIFRSVQVVVTLKILAAATNLKYKNKCASLNFEFLLVMHCEAAVSYVTMEITE
jgi:hypothetical protein